MKLGSLLFAITIAWCWPLASPAADLRIGAAAVNIKADDSMVLGGMMGPTWAKGQEGELRATAVVVEKPGSTSSPSSPAMCCSWSEISSIRQWPKSSRSPASQHRTFS